VSAILTEALNADYWKPVQSGTPKDSDQVRFLISNSKTNIIPERHFLKAPESPHSAAIKEGIHIKKTDFVLPDSQKLIVEGAGGVMVPLSEGFLIIDLIKHLELEVILVSNNYLGSINHTLLSFLPFKLRNIPIKGIIFNGESRPEAEDFILKYTQLPCLLRIEKHPEMNKRIVLKYAEEIRRRL
jgi:dethiobiotin synthetase